MTANFPNTDDPVASLYWKWVNLRAKGLNAPNEDCDRILDEADEIEVQIWAMPATSLGGLLCKARIVEDWHSRNGDDQCPFNDRDWTERVVVLLRMEVERLACQPSPCQPRMASEAGHGDRS